MDIRTERKQEMDEMTNAATTNSTAKDDKEDSERLDDDEGADCSDRVT